MNIFSGQILHNTEKKSFSVQIYWYEGISSYEEQGAAQLSQLVTAFGSISPVLLLGDFNVGDAVAPDINATQLGNDTHVYRFGKIPLFHCMNFR